MLLNYFLVPNNEDMNIFRYFKHGKCSKWNVLECNIGLIDFGECHAFCFIENRMGISQIYPKIEEFVQIIHFSGN